MTIVAASEFIIKFLSPELVETFTVEHYGDNEFTLEKFQEIRNEWLKPIGGLWTSPINSHDGWKDADCSIFTDMSKSFKLRFKSDAKFLRVDSFEDLLNLPKYNLIPNTSISSPFVDFEAISKEADVFWLTSKGFRETRAPKLINGSLISLGGWDCETVLIMNPNCCYQIK